MQLNLTDAEVEALGQEPARIVDGDHYPFSASNSRDEPRQAEAGADAAGSFAGAEGL